MKKITFTALTFILFIGVLSSQTNSTGVINLSNTPGLEYSAQIDITASEVKLTLTGPADRWLGLGLGVNSMTSGEDVVVYSGGTSTNTLGTISDRTFNGINVTPSLDGAMQNWNLITNDITTQAGDRILVATRGLNTGVDNDYVFSLTDTSINLVWARGNGTLSLSNHGGSNRGITSTGFTLGISDFVLNEFKISPNPVSTVFKVELPDTVENANVGIYDVLGKQLYSGEISKLISKIDVTDFSNGIYLVRVSNGNSSQTKRIIKQ